MSPTTRSVKQHAKARQRRRLTAQERLDRDRAQAQQAAQALGDMGFPTELVTELEGRLRSQLQLLGNICGVMLPSLLGCRTNAARYRVRGWDKTLPSRLLGALPTRSWLTRRRRVGVEVLAPLWRDAASQRAATRRRWQRKWVGDAAGCNKDGQPWGLVGTWWRGQEKRVLSRIDGVRLVVVIGEGTLAVPGDGALRRPDSTGAGGSCRDTRRGVERLRDGRVAAWRWRGWWVSGRVDGGI
jgi:hypothetical protein